MQAPAGVWPITVAGWVTLVSVPLTIGTVIFGWGKFFGKLETILSQIGQLREDFEKHEKEGELVEDDVRVLKITMWGVKGDNGMSLDIKEMKGKINDIHERNTRIDAVRAREEGAQQAGVEHRIAERRREDKILRGDPDA